ncbi:MAG: dethiobiotin synthase [Nitrospirota bacterium]
MTDFFITGTDTGVGKTIVAGAIAIALKAKGMKVGVMKPAETGCRERRGELFPKDAAFLKKVSGTDMPLDIICPYRFPEALAPAIAADRVGVKIDMRVIKRHFELIRRQSDVVLVEGAGGLMVPLSGEKLYLDLAVELGLPLIIVGRAGLGTINHTLLTVSAARARKIKISAIILNQGRKNKPDAASISNPEAIKRLSGTRRLFSLPFIPGIRNDAALLKKGADILLSQGFLA